jgi:hypothetical protein
MTRFDGGESKYEITVAHARCALARGPGGGAEKGDQGEELLEHVRGLRYD